MVLLHTALYTPRNMQLRRHAELLYMEVEQSVIISVEHSVIHSKRDYGPTPASHGYIA